MLGTFKAAVAAADGPGMSSMGHQAYQARAIETASPEQLTLMCYDGAIRFMRRARLAHESGDRGKVSESVGRAQAVINELNVTLNMEAGGEISQNLRDIYLFINRHLATAVMEQRVEAIDEAIGLLQPIRDAWSESMNLEQQAA